MIESTSQKLQKSGGAEREARVSDTIWHDKAQQVWDEIFDDDECCEGHPEGVEYHEEPVVKRLAAFAARCANEARLEEARWWRAQIDSRLHGVFYKTNDPTAARRIEDERIAELEAKK